MVRYILAVVSAFFMFLFLIFILTPKFLILDRILMKNDIFLLADSVKEGLLGLEIKNVKLYQKDNIILKDADIHVSLRPISLSLDINCNKNISTLKVYPSKDFDIELKDMNCFTVASSMDGKLYTKGGIYGHLKLKGIKAKLKDISSIDIDFKGNTLFFNADVEGIKVSGSGNVSYNIENPFASKINAVASSAGFNIVISGQVSNLKIDMQ